ncbi:MAG TPA: agmatine deiminase family protein [Candidatus Acidoferrales bacterium]|nr:agmatine deiminase family protein [Candidatus Acidoferrales bacterium]
MIRPESGVVPPHTTFRMPAEWEQHEATWLSWPHELTDWPGKFSPIPWAFAEIVRHLAAVERVFLIVQDHVAEARAKAVLEKAGAPADSVRFFHVPTDRGWMRDSGPIGVVSSPNDEPRAPVASPPPSKDESATLHAAAPVTINPRSDGARTAGVLLNFDFNGWAKYGDHKKDARVVALANRKLQKPLIVPEHKKRRVVLEGGAIDVNGCGTMLTTEECLLSEVQSRNPGYTKFDYAQVFKKYLGVTNVLWLRHGIAGDDTHGHIDDLARFVDARTVVIAVEEDRTETNYEPLQENLALLGAMKDQDGHPLRVEKLPMPRPVYFAGQRLPASYANFYIANGIVLVPTFNDPADRIALNSLASVFPGHKVVPIYSRDLVLGLGTIHCMTQQFPRIG